MTAAVLQRLRSVIQIDDESITKPGENETILWEFDKELAQKPATYFHPLILMHPVLYLEYSVLCTKLAHDFSRKGVNKEELIEQLVAVLMMAELLTHIYRDFLGVPREVLRFQNEKKIFRELLETQKYSFKNVPKEEVIVLSPWSGQRVRGATPNWNFPRLVTGRSRRVLATLVPVLKDIESFEFLGRYMAAIDPYVVPVLTYASWLFFAPRLTVNTLFLLKHVIPGWWMDTKERNLGGWLRFQAQLQRRWFELGNDSLWMTSGLLNCFVLTGPLAPIGMYLTISLFLFDVLWARLRVHIEHRRLSNLQKDYDDLALQMPLEGKESAELTSYREHLDRRVDFEERRLFITLVNTHMLMFGMCFAFPALAVNPLLPFIGALIVLATTLMVNRYLQGLEQIRPVDRVMGLGDKHGKSVYETGLTLFRPNVPSDSPNEARLHKEEGVVVEMGKLNGVESKGIGPSRSAPNFLNTSPLSRSESSINPTGPIGTTPNAAFM